MSLLGLVPGYGDDTSTSSDSEGETPSDKCTVVGTERSREVEQLETQKLPLPFLEASISKPNPSSASTSKEFTTRAYQSSSVFYNPFKAEEKQKLSVLEKHVQLSENAPTPIKDKKRVCWKFQKGKCRFGDKCRFAHNANPVSTEKSNESKTEEVTPTKVLHFSSRKASYEPDEDEAQWEEKKNKKRRTGVTDSLVPPKRAIRAFEQQQVQERPWMQN